MAQPDELRIFISSTFRDMEAERKHLLRRIFPQIRAICRERGVTFTEIDLRWGLTEEEATLGRVIRTCLEEIDRCRPHFVGIIGSRYGWIPEYHEVIMDPQLTASYPDVEEMALEGKSITEMEFVHGALRLPEEIEGAVRFYVRQGERESPEDAEKIESLLRRIRSSALPLQEFDAVEEFGRMVYDDLMETIDRFWPPTEMPSDREQEERPHKAFARSRRRAFVPDAETISTFNRWLAEGSLPLLIHGESGLGKSATTAFLVDTFRRKNPNGIIIEHYIGASERSGTITDVVRHVLLATIDTVTRTNSLTNLAQIRYQTGDMEGAADLMRKVLETRVREYGQQHPLAAESMNNIGAIHHGLGDFETSLTYMQKAADIRRSVFGDRHTMSLRARSNVAMTLHGLGRTEEAEQILREVLPTALDLFGPEHFELTEYYLCMSAVMTAQGKFNETDAWLDRATQIVEASPEQTRPPALIRIGFERAGVRAAEGRVDEAIEILDALVRTHTDPDPLIARQIILVQKRLDELRNR